MTDRSPSIDDQLDRTVYYRAFYLTIVCYIFAGALRFRGLIHGEGLVIGLIGAPFFCFLFSKGLWAVQGAVAEHGVHALLSAGNIKYQQGYSIQESMIARGKFDDAAESFRTHLLEFPDDIPARLRLATLHLRERNDPAAAEAELLGIRRRRHDRSTAMFVANHLVDLYRATGQTGKLMAELTRMIREWPGTPMADGAGKLLADLKRERDAGG